MFPVYSSNLNLIQRASSTSSLMSEGGIWTIASLFLGQYQFNLHGCPIHHSGSTWRVCWQKERQDQKGLIIVVLAPAEGNLQDWKGLTIVVLLQQGRLPTKHSTHFGVSSDICAPKKGKTRLERCNYSCTAQVGPTPHIKQHTFLSIFRCTCASGRKIETERVNLSYYNGRYAMPKKKKKKKKGKADLTTVLHIRELPHLHMKLAV